MLRDYAERIRGHVTFTIGSQPHTPRQYNEVCAGATSAQQPTLLDARPPRRASPHLHQVILDAEAWQHALPHTIEAFFYPDAKDCAAECQGFVRDAHAKFSREHPDVEEATPLLRLSLGGEKSAPFTLDEWSAAL